MKTLRDFVLSGEFLIAAHRGASGLAPENTIPAFELATDEGANMIETDVHFTSDGHIVAFHDFEHLRKSNNLKFDEINTLEDIRKIDVGSWFDPKFAGEKAPTLQEILEFAKDKTYLNFEIKTNNHRIDDKQIKKMINIIYDYDMMDYLMFSSFNYDLLKLIKTVDKKLHTAAINIPFHKFLPSQLAQLTYADAIVCSIDELNDDINQDSIDNNIFLAVYSVDNEEQLEYIRKFNVSALGTNYPAKIRNLIAKIF
jgi:glycerophosphoryl diester phosphodiesterase